MIRTAERSDYKAIRSMLKSGIVEGTLKPRKKKELKRNLSGFVVAEEEGQLVGMASVVIYDRRLAEVRSVYVDPEYRGNGIAKELVQTVTERSVKDLPSHTVFAITTTPELFESDGYGGQQGNRNILFKNI